RDDIATIAGVPAGFKVSDNSDPTFTVPAENGEYALYLDRISYKVSYAFKDTDGNVIDAAEATKTDAEVVFEGEIDTTYPTIPDYEYVSNDAPAKMPANDITVTFTYRKNAAIIKLVAKDGKTTMVERDGVVEMNADQMPTSSRRPNTVSEIIPVDRDTYEYDNSDSQTFNRWFITGLTEGLTGEEFLADWVELTDNVNGRIELVSLSRTGIVRTRTVVEVYDKMGTPDDESDDVLVEKFWVVIYGDITGDGYCLSDDSSAAENEVLNRRWDPANVQLDFLKTKAADISSYDGTLQSDDVAQFEQVELQQRKIDQQLGRTTRV
ncbi:MAG: MucBP domain-containing protein, partial [Clostridia bacterium]|nr:MucBP domain-containing protein [Clostridia bacterium]